MAHAVEVHSKRQSGTKAVARPSAGSQPCFKDSFFAEWIDRRLGPSENRQLLLLLVDGSSASELAEYPSMEAVAAMVASHGGHVVQRLDNQLLGVWGLTNCDTADRRRVLIAATEISNVLSHEPMLRCLLHAKSVCVSKQDLDSAEKATLAALSGLLGAAQVAADLPDTVVVTEAFKAACNLNSGLLPVGLPAPWSGPADAMLYALAAPGFDVDQGTQQDIGSEPLGMASRLDALGDLKPLILAAAIVGRVFTQELLARMLGMENRRLSEALTAAQATKLICEEPSPKGVKRFYFLDKRLQRFAYEMVPPQQRLGLHRVVAEALRQSPIDSLASPPDQVARHHRIANDPLQSRRWLSKAAWRAVSTDDAATAVAHLEKALAQEGPPTEISAFRRSLLQLLGVQLAVARGNGSDAVFDAYQQSIATSNRLPYLTWRQEARSLWLAQSTHLVKGEVRAALTLGSLLLMHLQRQADRSSRTVGMRLLAYRMHALALMLSGQLHSALEHYDMVIRDYDEAHHARLRFAYGSDQLALAHAHRAWTLALLGRRNKVAAEVQAARRACDRLDHPHTTAHAMSVAAIALLSSEATDAALFAAREARATAAQYRFPYWVAWSDIILAVIETPAKPRTTYYRLHDAMLAYQETGAAQLCPFARGLLSAAALASHQHDLALRQADAGLALIAQNGCTLYRPELLRHRARALFAVDRCDEADAALHSGYEDAGKSGAMLFRYAISRDGLKLTTNQRQIRWQALYHAVT